MNGGREFVTGGAGFTGSHSCKILAAAGFAPIVYDNLSTGHRIDVRWASFGRAGDRALARSVDIYVRENLGYGE
jgi:UDP-arabinose 4-epimerase